MADYQSMYVKLFRNVTSAIKILQNAQQQTEEMFISAEPTNIQLIHTNIAEDEKNDTENDGTGRKNQ